MKDRRLGFSKRPYLRHSMDITAHGDPFKMHVPLSGAWRADEKQQHECRFLRSGFEPATAPGWILSVESGMLARAPFRQHFHAHKTVQRDLAMCGRNEALIRITRTRGNWKN